MEHKTAMIYSTGSFQVFVNFWPWLHIKLYLRCAMEKLFLM